ncbi:unnamed protein product [Meloidogyne enterolobii]|uniref:Uncharacterized protein n=1 Tax=Meloidogyne enterolobii TaxID=390850 RepID=A0ACB0YSD6_MELEN
MASRPQPRNGYSSHLASSSSSSSHPSGPSSSITSTSSINRSQRCGVCRGCQCKPCGQCTYCQDSPQFGGPGVKKQSCVERRCLRVLENRLQVNLERLLKVIQSDLIVRCLLGWAEKGPYNECFLNRGYLIMGVLNREYLIMRSPTFLILNLLSV